jgi:aspartyl-tRNA(Asn)/glutamyl-tRNA(Gln) amidotransferase subunit A
MVKSVSVLLCVDPHAEACSGSQIPLDPETDRTNTAAIYAHTRSLGLGWEVQKRILLGTYALTAE